MEELPVQIQTAQTHIFQKKKKQTNQRAFRGERANLIPTTACKLIKQSELESSSLLNSAIKLFI